MPVLIAAFMEQCYPKNAIYSSFYKADYYPNEIIEGI